MHKYFIDPTKEIIVVQQGKLQNRTVYNNLLQEN